MHTPARMTTRYLGPEGAGTMSDDARAWEDRDAIQQLIYRYSDAVTRADYEQMATVFADDAVWESPILGMHFDARESSSTSRSEGVPASMC